MLSCRQSVILVLLSLRVCNAYAQDSKVLWPIADYTAAGNPTNQNWSVTVNDPATSIWAEAVFDAAHGTNAWMTHGEAGMVGGGIMYRTAFSGRTVSLGKAHGWTVETRMRASGTPEGPMIGVEIDDRGYYLAFYGTHANHALLLAVTNLSQMAPGPPFVGVSVTTTATYADYHVYGMTYDPDTDSAIVTVDGHAVLTNYRGMPHHLLDGKSVFWGSGGTYTSDETYWLNVGFCVALPRPTISTLRVPEPNRVAVEWFAYSNMLYRAERTASLTAPSWLPTGSTVTGQSSTAFLSIEAGSANCQFLRLEARPEE